MDINSVICGMCVLAGLLTVPECCRYARRVIRTGRLE